MTARNRTYRRLTLFILTALFVTGLAATADVFFFEHRWNPQVQAYLHFPHFSSPLLHQAETSDTFSDLSVGGTGRLEVCPIAWLLRHSQAWCEDGDHSSVRCDSPSRGQVPDYPASNDVSPLLLAPKQSPPVV